MFRGKMGLGGITWHVKTVESIEVYRVMYTVQYETEWKWGGGGGRKKGKPSSADTGSTEVRWTGGAIGGETKQKQV